MENKTNSKKEYLKRWNSYLDGCYILSLTPSLELGKEVHETIDKLKSLVLKVAEDKGLK